jgi:hypothetical protein
MRGGAMVMKIDARVTGYGPDPGREKALVTVPNSTARRIDDPVTSTTAMPLERGDLQGANKTPPGPGRNQRGFQMGLARHKTPS